MGRAKRAARHKSSTKRRAATNSRGGETRLAENRTKTPLDYLKRPEKRLSLKYEDPLYGGSLMVDWKPKLNGEWAWFYYSRRGGGGEQYTLKLAAHLGRSIGDLYDGRVPLGPLRSRSNGGPPEGEPEELPSDGAFAGWAARLWSKAGTPGRRYLIRKRGNSEEVIKGAGIGWDGDRERLTFPMYRDGELVAYKWRKPGAAGQMRNCAGSGRAWPLYPEPRPEDDWVLLVAGELDALCGRSAGLPACSVTLGAGYSGERWDDWADAIGDRLAIVAFDNNERFQARAAVKRLRSYGLTAKRLDLRRLGLKTAKGDLSNYLNGGGSPNRISRPARRAAR